MTIRDTSRRAGWPFYLGILLIVLAVRLPLHPISTLTVDESAYMLVARDLLDGIWPFAGNFDHKPVGLYYLYAIAMGLGGDDPSSIRWLATLSAALSALTAFWMADRLFKLPRGIAIGATAAWILGSFMLEGYSSNTEIILNAYLMLWIAAFLAFWMGEARAGPSAILSGLAAGLAIQVNYLVGPLLAILYLSALLFAPKKHFGWLFASGLISIAVAALHFVPLLIAGTLGDYIAMQTAFLGQYQSDVLAVAWHEIVPVLASQLIPLLVAAVILFAATGNVAGHRDKTLFGLIALGGGIFVAVASMRFYPHYFHLILPGLFVMAVSSLSRVRDLWQRLLTIVLVGCTIPGFGIMVSQIERGLSTRSAIAKGMLPEGDRNRAVALHFAEETADASTGYVVCDHPVFYFLMDLEDLTDLPFYSLHIYEYLPGIVAEEEVAAIHAQRPDVMLIGEMCYDEEAAMIMEIFADYEFVGEHELARLYRAPSN